MQRPISVAQETESTCLGSGMLAAAACGIHGSIKEAAEAMSGVGARYEPGEDGPRYQKLYDVYKDIYPSLRPLFPRLTEALKG
jgi:xylulokinase